VNLIYGVFLDRQPAEQALDNLHKASPDLQAEVVSAAIHDRDLRNEDLPRSGNFATRPALIGALLVGGFVGLFLALLMTGTLSGVGGPSTIIGSKPIDAVLLTLAAAAFGGILAGIAGTAGNRTKVQGLHRKLSQGKTLVTLESSNDRAKTIIRTLTRSGAIEAGTI